MTTVQCLDFFMVVSATDLVSWADSVGATLSPSPELIKLGAAIGIAIDPVWLYEEFFERTRLGEGDVHLYRSKSNGSLLAFNLYRDPQDQLDLIAVCAQTPTVNGDLRAAFRGLFDGAECQVMYEEGSHLVHVRELLDTSAYPRMVKASDYAQELVVNLVELPPGTGHAAP